MTPDRYQRIQSVLATRQIDLTVCMEEVHKPNNVSAIVRTADAVGIHKVHAVWPDDKMRMLSHTSAGARNWVELETHDTMVDAVQHLKSQGMQVLATNLSDTAIDFREVDYTKPTAIILGGEKNGITQEALNLADQDIIIPMVGMVQSLNVSVASASFCMKHNASAKTQACTTKQPPSYLTKWYTVFCLNAAIQYSPK